MNSTINSQLEHKTIRKFKKEKINPEIIEILFEVATRAASSNAMYSYSMIYVKNQEKKAQIASVCNQEYVKDTSDLIVFVVDTYRNTMIAKENGVDEEACDIDSFMQGVSDAIISAQNMVVAAESMGIGTVYFGSILNDVQKISSILNLPRLTFPIIAVGLGYKDEEPQLKPRLPKYMQIFEDEYKTFDNYTNLIEGFDKEMQNYVDLRDKTKTVGKFSLQIANKIKNSRGKKRNLVDEIIKRGFNIKIV